MRKNSILRILAALSAVVILCFTLNGCGGNDPAPAPAPEPAPQTEEQGSSQQVDSPESPESPAAPEGSGSEEGSAQPEQIATIRVGNDTVGWVDVPEDWVVFTDVEGGDDFQYSDRSGSRIVTLNVVEADPSYTTEDVAYAIWDNLDESGMQDSEGAVVTLAGRQAYQIYGAFDDGIVLVVWLVEDDAGTIHYVAIEGPADYIYGDFELVESTYSFTQ